MSPDTGIVPRIGQAGMQTAAIGKAGALRHGAFTVEQQARLITRAEFIKTRNPRQTLPLTQVFLYQGLVEQRKQK